MEGERAGGDSETPEERANRRVCALFDVCREAGSPRGTRDAALVSVLYGANVGRDRAVRLVRDAYDERTGRLDPRRTAAGPGSGDGPDASGGPEAGHRRWATDGARRALDDWVRLRGDEAGALFCPIEADRPVPGRPLPAGRVDEVLARWARAAGLDGFCGGDLRDLYESPWWRASCPR